MKVLGAGPAGLIVGLHLLNSKDVTILEKESRIVPSTCGEGIDLNSLYELNERTGFNSDRYISKFVKGAKFIYPNQKSFTYSTLGAVLDRDSWVMAMAEEFINDGGVIEFGSTGRCDIDCSGPKSGVVGVQYNVDVKYDSDYLEFYMDKRFSDYYTWIFPKKNTTNIGLVGKYADIDRFIEYKKIEGRVLSKKGGLIPIENGNLIKGNRFFLGDSAGMCNPVSLGGLVPIIYASDILVRNIDNPEKYRAEVLNHPMSSPALESYAKYHASFSNNDLDKIGEVVDGGALPGFRLSPLFRMLKYPSLIPKLKSLGEALKISMDYGW